MSNINRMVLTTGANGVSPTGYTNPSDANTIMRNCASLLAATAQGAQPGNLALSYNPVAAQATVNTTNGSETANDTLTVAGVAITLKSSGATSNQANIAAGSAGTSTGAANGAITTAGAVASFYININGDGFQLVSCIGTTGAGIASNLQAAIRALTPNNTLNAVAFSSATVAYTSTHYLITSGAAGNNSSVVVSANPGGDPAGGGATSGAALLKIGVYNGGTEAVGTATTLNNIATLINGAASSWAGICSAFVCGANMTLKAAIPGTIGNGLALAVSSTGSTMTITHAWGASVAGTEGAAYTYSLGL